ncbi:toll/interleukin-1 receptor domain-containing protein [Hyunsoonleella pacifica]|uniref:Toll/interleukin-1 receptor domain-containing protein n=1 Tax=Hyunsoonleella pacifica TaxID=1080224 RepID=A0A4Q9FT10_9FLAO|nr:toll/interleukin-1 receptor domain-containing protein [Hyunsoonleella pacifica]TBN18840.1 toll/interleukin-1 receptor domain-containing protein [Hyunsoonleella pacifica]GGD05226.1 hypothetical protein GCM10011368_03780 [Hyunsoonleella pacifica]
MKFSFKKFLFGHDVFISYSRKDTSDYAAALVNELTKKKIECFIDQHGTEPGEDLPSNLKRTLLRCDFFVLLGSDNALKSEAVLEEVVLFKNQRNKRPIIPVDFGSLEDADWFDEIRGLALAKENSDALMLGQPSEKIVKRILDTIGFNTKNSRLRKLTYLTITAILFGLLVAFFTFNSFQKIIEQSKHTIGKLNTESDSLLNSIEIGENRIRDIEKLAQATQKRADRATRLEELAKKSLQEVRTTLKKNQFELDLSQAINEFRNGEEQLVKSDVFYAEYTFEKVYEEFTRIEMNPIIIKHALAATEAGMLGSNIITTLQPAVSYIFLSENEKKILIVYDHQNFGGNPELEGIQDWTSFEVIDLQTGERFIEKEIGSEVGAFIYSGLHRSEIAEFKDSGEELLLIQNDTVFYEYSLITGIRKEVEKSNEYSKIENNYLKFPNPKESRDSILVNNELDDDNLYRTHPDDGIDVEYGRRLVDHVIVESPDGRIIFAGTYEGRMLVLDTATGFKRGEMQGKPVFAAQFAADGKSVFVADEGNLWQIDTSSLNSVNDFSLDLVERGKYSWKNEKLLDVRIANDGTALVVITTDRIRVLRLNLGEWVEWYLPQLIKEVSCLRINPVQNEVHFISGKGIIFCYNYSKNKGIYDMEFYSPEDSEFISWIDKGKKMVWLAEKKIYNNQIKLIKKSIKNSKPRISYLEIPEAEDYFEREVHAIARLGNELNIFYGDSETFSKDSECVEGRVLMMSINESNIRNDTLIFEPSSITDGLGEVHWNVDRIKKILSVSNKNKIMALKEFNGTMVIDNNAEVSEIMSNLGAWEVIFNKINTYLFELNFSEETDMITLSISHQFNDLDFAYHLPWRFSRKPEFASVSMDGKKIVLANEEGDIMIHDVSSYIPD